MVAFQYILVKGGFFEQVFDNSSFEVWWYKTRSQRSNDDAGDCREENTKVFVQQFCVNWDQDRMIWGQSFGGFPKQTVQ